MQGFDKIPPVISEEIANGENQIWWPYLLMDQNHLRAETTRPLVEHLRQVSKKSDQWSWRRCDNKIAIVLRAISDFKDGAAIWPHLLTDQNRFLADTSRGIHMQGFD